MVESRIVERKLEVRNGIDKVTIDEDIGDRIMSSVKGFWSWKW